MSLYDLNTPKINIGVPWFWRSKNFWVFASVILTSSFFGFVAGMISGSVFYFEAKNYFSKFSIDLPQKSAEQEYVPQTTQEEKIINAVNNVSPAVVTIVISKNVPVFEQYYINPFESPSQEFDFSFPVQRQVGTEKQDIGGGTGFIVSKDGTIVTNKHVVSDEEAEYTVFTNDGKKFSAKVLAKDPAQDLAVLKVEPKDSFTVVKLGDSDEAQIGQTVIAIGNALGEFRNTISVGVISGLGRTITAESGGTVETIEDVIQTDAAINKGNSGGPLLNLAGEVIGINTATVLEAQNIGFAIPINKAKKAIEQITTAGKITYPFLGIRYTVITEKIQQENELPVSYGAWIVAGRGEPAVVPNSAADKAGLQKDDIILEFNGEKITSDNSLGKIIMKYNPGDKVLLKVLRQEKELNPQVVLEARS